MSIRVISYNIHSGVGIDKVFNYKRIGQFLAKQEADIVCLQEMDLRYPAIDKEEQIEQLKADYFTDFIASPAVFTDTGWYGNAILTRVKPVSKRSIDISVEGRQPRNIQDVVFSLGDNRLRILNTHMGLKQFERAQQFSRLEAVIDETLMSDNTPILVTGDFNEWQLFPRTLRGISQKLQAVPLGPTFPNKLPVFKLDKFWCHPKQLVKQAKVIKTTETYKYSDHFPILAELITP